MIFKDCNFVSSAQLHTSRSALGGLNDTLCLVVLMSSNVSPEPHLHQGSKPTILPQDGV